MRSKNASQCHNVSLAPLIVARLFFRLQTFMCAFGCIALLFWEALDPSYPVLMCIFWAGCFIAIGASSHMVAGAISRGRPLPLRNAASSCVAYAAGHLLPVVQYLATLGDLWEPFTFGIYYFSYPFWGFGFLLDYWVVAVVGSAGGLLMPAALWLLQTRPTVQLVFVGPSFVPVLFRWLVVRAVAAVTFFAAPKARPLPNAAGSHRTADARSTTSSLKSRMTPFAPRLRVYAWLWAAGLVLWSVGNIMVCVAQGLLENRLVEILTPHWILLSALCAQALAAVLGMRSMTVPYTTDTAHAYVLVLLLLCTSLGVCGALYYPQPILWYGDFLSRSLELQMVVVGCMLFVVGLLLLPFVGPALLMLAHGSSMAVGNAAQGDKT